MINQICYVLTSSGTDLYAQMTFISASLSRRLYPDAQIIVLVDEITDVNLIKCKSPLIKLVNRIVRVETGIEKAAPRSRFVKTSMRQVLDGDFVFIDADAIPIRRFDEIRKADTSLAASLDINHYMDRPHFPDFAKKLLQNCGWNTELQHYFNSGVIFMADSPSVREFGLEWHKKWLFMWEKTNDHRDQPAFNSAIESTGISVLKLPEIYNAAMYASPWKACNAKILHYWMHASEGELSRYSLLSHLLDVYRNIGEIDWLAVDRTRIWPFSFNTWREILLPALFGPRGGFLRVLMRKYF